MKNRYSLKITLFSVFCVVLLLFVSEVFAQTSFTISGQVSDQQGVLPGVTVREAGTNNATLTDKEGRYEITVSDADGSLLFSYIGYESETVAIENKTTIDVRLVLSSQQLTDVVVTALGISREKKALGYDVSNVGSEDLNRVPQENVLTGLSGKVTGVAINQVGGTGSSINMTIRGANSLSNDNQPLFVIDGVPINNTLNNVSSVGDRNIVDFGNAISSLNPEDIEDISILKGPSAAALYGSRAGNGVVLITTKNGSGVGRMTVSVSSSTVFDVPYKYVKRQHHFSSGAFSGVPFELTGNLFTNLEGVGFDEGTDGAFGMELDRGYEMVQWNSPLDENGKPIPMPLVSHPNNMKNFFQTGITSQNTVSIANNNDFINYRISFSDMRNRGNIPESDLFRKTLDLSVGMKVNDKLRLTTDLNFSRNNSNNRPSEGRGANPLYALDQISPHIDVRDLKDYWEPGLEGLQQRTQYNGVFDNPWFLVNEAHNRFKRDRLYGNMRLDWQIHPKVNLMLRYGIDTYSEQRRMEIPVSYTREPKGAYGVINLKPFESNADFLATYENAWSDVFSLSLSLGGNTRYQTANTVNTSSKDRVGLVVPNIYTLQNILPSGLNYSSSYTRRMVNSLYGFATFGYRDFVYLDVSARNDWSSTLPGADPFFYPSASLSMILNEMIGISTSQVNLIKLRGGIAQVGNDAGVYQLENVLNNAGAWGDIPRYTTSGTILNANLKPEKITSYEGGLEVNLFKDRLRLSGTYYIIEDKDQIFNTQIPSSSLHTNKVINAGLVRSKGVEFSLGLTPVKTRDWRWDLNFNFTRNRSKIIRLAEEMPFFSFWEEVKGGAWTYEGETIGDIYGAEVRTVDDPESPYYGFPLLANEDGAVKWSPIDAHNTKHKVGNFNPDFNLGMQTSLTYKNWSLNMTFDWRKGGDFVSQTFRYGMENGQANVQWEQYFEQGDMSERELRDYLIAHKEEMVFVDGRNFPRVGWPTLQRTSYPFSFEGFNIPYGGIIIPGVYRPDPDNIPVDEHGNPVEYIENLGENILGENGTLPLPFAATNPWDFVQAFTFPSDYIKLREISISYTLPRLLISSLKLQDASVSLYSRNIVLYTKAKLNIDPERAFQANSGTQAGTQFSQGIELYNMHPWVMPVGIKLNVTF